MRPVSSKNFWQFFAVTSSLTSALAVYQTVQQISALGILVWHSKWIFLLGLFALNMIAGIFLLLKLASKDNAPWVDKLELAPSGAYVKLTAVLLIVLSFSWVWVARLRLFGNILPQFAPLFWIFLWASLLQSQGLKVITGVKWFTAFAVVVLVQGLVYQIYGHLTVISDFPFSIGYSEASRHYYSSLFFAKPLYDVQMAWPFLHPSRYLLMSLPFLVNGLPLWFHRMWQAFLWIGLTAASSILLTRRLQLKGWMPFVVASWAFLFYLQGAVYYHLQVCVILVFVGVSARRPWRSLFFVIIASLWAGISRVNWFPVPAMLAIAIYILETPLENKSWRYWIQPFVLGICGLAAALTAQFLYIHFSGNADVRSFGSSFTSDLLWNRLLPNETFPLGILSGMLIVSAPLIFAIIQMTRGKLSHLHPLRWLALLGLLLVLFLGGMVVSVKIGGGADLHNMDAFLVMLALIAASFYAGRVAGDDASKPLWGQIHWPVAATLLLVPLGFALPQIGATYRYDPNLVNQDLQQLQQVVSQTVNDGGEILFVTERQLLTFDLLQNVALVPEYEQIELMEMAMSGNRDYLEHFYADLKSHRFEFILAEEQKFTQQKNGAFIEENNAWVRYVGAPLLCAYKPLTSLSSVNVQIFVPRPGQPDCKDPFSR